MNPKIRNLYKQPSVSNIDFETYIKQKNEILNDFIEISKEDMFNQVADCPAIYVFLTKDLDILYVGKAKDASERMKQHLYLREKGTKYLLPHVDIIKIKYFEEYKKEYCVSDLLSKHEKEYINSLYPIFNCADVKYRSFYIELHNNEFTDEEKINLVSELISKWRINLSNDKYNNIAVNECNEEDSMSLILFEDIESYLSENQKYIFSVKQAIKYIENTMNEEDSNKNFIINNLNKIIDNINNKSDQI